MKTVALLFALVFVLLCLEITSGAPIRSHTSQSAKKPGDVSKSSIVIITAATSSAKPTTETTTILTSIASPSTSKPVPEPIPATNPLEFEQKQYPPMKHTKIDPKKFKNMGNLVMETGKRDDPMVHARANKESHPVVDMRTNDELNKLRSIGTEIKVLLTDDVTIERTKMDNSEARKKEKESMLAEKKALDELVGKKLGEEPEK